MITTESDKHTSNDRLYSNVYLEKVKCKNAIIRAQQNIKQYNEILTRYNNVSHVLSHLKVLAPDAKELNQIQLAVITGGKNNNLDWEGYPVSPDFRGEVQVNFNYIYQLNSSEMESFLKLELEKWNFCTERELKLTSLILVESTILDDKIKIKQRIRPILGYTPDAKFDPENMPWQRPANIVFTKLLKSNAKNYTTLDGNYYPVQVPYCTGAPVDFNV